MNNIINAMLFLLITLLAGTGCERVDVAEQDEYKIIPPTSSYNPNVVSYWKFDMATRYEFDSRIGYPTLTLIYTDNLPIIDSGKYSDAYQPSNGNYMYLPSGSSVLYDSVRFLVEAWVKSTDTSGVQAVFSKCNTTIREGWSCRLNGGHPEIWYGIDGVTAVAVTSVAPALIVPADGNWHYIAFIFGQQVNSSSGNNIYFYVDGVSERADLSSTCQNSVTNLNFGYEWDGSTQGNFFNGSIDELAYWSLPEYISWDSIEATLARRNDGLQYGTTKMLFY